MAKPITQETVDKAVEKATTAAEKKIKAAMKEAIRDVKALIADHTSDAKTAGNKDGAKRITNAGNDVVAKLKELVA